MQLSGKKLTTAILAGLMGATMFGSSVFADTTLENVQTLANQNSQKIGKLTDRVSNLETASSDATQNTKDIAQNKTDIAANKTDIAQNKTDIAANKTDIAQNKTDIAANKTDIAQNKTDIAANKTDIAQNKTDIAANKTDIAQNKTDIAANKTDIAQNKTDIANNTTRANMALNGVSNAYQKINTINGILKGTDGTGTSGLIGQVDALQKDSVAVKKAADLINGKTDAINKVDRYEGRLTTVENVSNNNAAAIGFETDGTAVTDGNFVHALSQNTEEPSKSVTIGTNLNALDDAISTTNTYVEQNMQGISDNRDSIGKINGILNGTDGTGNSGLIKQVNDNTTNITTNKADIAQNKADIAQNKTAIDKNTGDIATNKDNIAANKTAIDKNTGDIATNKDNIAANKTAIDKNTGDIATNKDNIAANKTAIDKNTGDIATNKDNIAANKTAIDKNTGDIATNKDNIAANKTAIDKNTGDIATNKADIAQNKTDITTNKNDIATNKKAINDEAATRQAADQNLQNQINNNSTSINDLYGRYSSLKTDINKVGARSAALAGLHPLDFDPANKLNFAVASGSFKGENSVALGAFYRPNENIMFSAASTMGDSDNAYTFGLSFKIGPSSAKTKTTSPDAEELYKVVGELQDQLAAQQKEIEQLKANKAK